MKIALLLDNFNNYKLLNNYDYIIGVDKGAYNAVINNFTIDYAIGDFDSIKEEDLIILKAKTKVKVLNPVKDETDTYEALKYAYTLSNDVTILGGIKGNRVEHLIANLNLFNKYNDLKIIDDNSCIFLTQYSLFLNDYNEYYYVSLFALEDVINLTLKGFKYPLSNYNLKVFDSLAISNEIVDNPSITFESGKLLIILTKKD